jgi:alpha-1,3-rhamnosyl/mannosyltransferase
VFYANREAGGAGRYARELIRSILDVEPETKITVFVGNTAPPDLVEAPWAPAVDWVRFPVPPVGAVRQLGVQFGAIPAIAARRRLDVVHGLANLVPPVAPFVATVATLLDVTWVHYARTMDRRATIGMKLLAPLCARSADRVIAISEAAKTDIVNVIGLKREKVDVTQLGIRVEQQGEQMPASEVRRRLRLGPGPIVLCVAQKRVHKNLERLVRALSLSRSPDLQLVLPGSPTPHEAELRSVAGELGLADRVSFPAWLEDDELDGLYKAASCFVLPSLAEGFGLPILEAMRHGIPVACSNVSSLPEVAGDAALLFPPEDVAAIADAIDRLVKDDELARELVRRGHERCRSFTWEKTAEATLASYRRAIQARRGSGGGLMRRRAHAGSSAASHPRSPSS